MMQTFLYFALWGQPDLPLQHKLSRGSRKAPLALAHKAALGFLDQVMTLIPSLSAAWFSLVSWLEK